MATILAPMSKLPRLCSGTQWRASGANAYEGAVVRWGEIRCHKAHLATQVLAGPTSKYHN